MCISENFAVIADVFHGFGLFGKDVKYDHIAMPINNVMANAEPKLAERITIFLKSVIDIYSSRHGTYFCLSAGKKSRPVLTIKQPFLTDASYTTLDSLVGSSYNGVLPRSA